MIWLEFALAGNHKNQSALQLRGSQNEILQGWMGLRHCHHMKVDAPLGPQLTAGQLPKGFCIHHRRRLRRGLCPAR